MLSAFVLCRCSVCVLMDTFKIFLNLYVCVACMNLNVPCAYTSLEVDHQFSTCGLLGVKRPFNRDGISEILPIRYIMIRNSKIIIMK